MRDTAKGYTRLRPYPRLNATLAGLRRSAWADGARLIVFGRLIPAGFFAWLAFMQFLRLKTDVSVLPNPVTLGALVVGVLPGALYLTFCGIPVFLYLGRPAPRARDGRLAPRAFALIGSLMLLAVGALPQGGRLYVPMGWTRGLATGLSIFAFTVIITALLYLRRNLSLMPQARRLVVDGPYRLIRHPLYAAEILATFAYVIGYPTVAAVAILAPFITVQLLRSRYEEQLLTATFPGYHSYASGTRRLIPLVW
jgi:protein-S-isoprenylcysteine O-methyltransferase Ste14